MVSSTPKPSATNKTTLCIDKIAIKNIKPNPGSTSMKDDVNAVLEIEDRKTVFSCIDIGRGEPSYISEGAPLDVEYIYALY